MESLAASKTGFFLMQNKIEVASPYVKQFNMVKVRKMGGG